MRSVLRSALPGTLSRAPALVALLLIALAGCQSRTPDEADYADDMREQHAGEHPVPSGATTGADSLDVVTERVTYATVDGTSLTGFLASPRTGETRRPALIIIHEWWGLNENIRAMTQRLAAEGYTALAVNLYGNRVAQTPDSAMAYMRSAMSRPSALTDNLKQAYTYLTEQRRAETVGAVGWCFGGAWSLRTALALPKQLDAAVIYYGRPVLDVERLATLEMPLLGLFGGNDTSIPVDSVRAFEAALTEAGVTHTIKVYDGAGHAFANPSGERYRPRAAEDAWRRTTAFLAKHLR